MGISTKNKNKGHPPKYIVNIGDIFGDLQCINIFFNEKTRFTNYKMKCLKCGREKIMLAPTIYRGSGIAHRACGKGLKLKDKKFYERWRSMRSRTTNPKIDHYDAYGGRGINSDEFENFIDFYDAMYGSYKELADKIGEENTSLERIDPNKSYTKENCTWIDKHDQPKNQRRTRRFIAIYPDGTEEICKNVQEFSRNHNLDDQSIYDCLIGNFKQTRGYKFIPMDR